MLSPFASWIAGKWKRVLKINIRDWTNLSNLNLSNVLFIIYTARKKTVSKFWSIPELIMQFSFNECTEMILATVGNITSSVICSHLPNYFPTLLVNLIPASSFPYEFSLKYSEWQLGEWKRIFGIDFCAVRAPFTISKLRDMKRHLLARFSYYFILSPVEIFRRLSSTSSQ